MESPLDISSKCFALMGGSQLIADNLRFYRKSADIGQELAGRQPQGLKRVTANLFPLNCAPPEYYMC